MRKSEDTNDSFYSYGFNKDIMIDGYLNDSTAVYTKKKFKLVENKWYGWMSKYVIQEWCYVQKKKLSDSRNRCFLQTIVSIAVLLKNSILIKLQVEEIIGWFRSTYFKTLTSIQTVTINENDLDQFLKPFSLNLYLLRSVTPASFIAKSSHHPQIFVCHLSLLIFIFRFHQFPIFPTAFDYSQTYASFFGLCYSFWSYRPWPFWFWKEKISCLFPTALTHNFFDVSNLS